MGGYPFGPSEQVILGLLVAASAMMIVRLLSRHRWRAAFGVPLLAAGIFILYYAAAWLLVTIAVAITQPQSVITNILLLGFFGVPALVLGGLLAYIGWRLLSPVRENLGLPSGTDERRLDRGGRAPD